MIRHYIFDFGNVLARYRPEELTALHIDDPVDAAAVCEAIFDRLYWDPLDAGLITDEALKEAACARLPQRLHESARLVYDRWIEDLQPIAGMQQLVADIKAQGGSLYLLSNISIGFAEGYRKNPWIGALLSLFDGLVFSGPLHITKPGEAIFRHLLQRFGLQAEECVFVDDSPQNIAGCEAVGIRGVLFTGDAAVLREQLQIPHSLSNE